MTNFVIGVVIGGIVTILSVKGEESFRRRKEIKQLKIENEMLRLEREELKNQVVRNTFQINDLIGLIKFHQEQIEHCLEWLSGISTIKNEIELQTHITTTKRFRQKYGLFTENKDLEQGNNIYMSD